MDEANTEFRESLFDFVQWRGWNKGCSDGRSNQAESWGEYLSSYIFTGQIYLYVQEYIWALSAPYSLPIDGVHVSLRDNSPDNMSSSPTAHTLWPRLPTHAVNAVKSPSWKIRQILRLLVCFVCVHVDGRTTKITKNCKSKLILLLT